MSQEQVIATVIASAIGGLILFVVLRELWCWYFKINEGLALLKAIAVKLGAEIPVKKREWNADGTQDRTPDA